MLSYGKSKIRNAIVKACRTTLFLGFYTCSRLIVPIMYRRAFRRGELSYLSEEDYLVWKKAMLTMLKEFCFAGFNFQIRKTVYTFAKSKIEIVRKSEPGSPEKPIVVLCVKNELQRIQMLTEHYRKLGIEKFAFLDNGSDDGTFEWLSEQADVDLFSCRERYQTHVKEGWINRIVSYYGFDRWYIVTDSDELCTYIGAETHPISDVIAYAEKNGIKRFKGLTIDMYPNGKLYQKTDHIQQDYCRMDYNTYYERDKQTGSVHFNEFWGGPRYRRMGSMITLSKWPIVYWEKGTISDSAHFQFPHDQLPKCECFIGILHYKFIDRDLETYKSRALPGSGFLSGKSHYTLYVSYVEENDHPGFLFADSIVFNGSESLKKIQLLSDMQLDNAD